MICGITLGKLNASEYKRAHLKMRPNLLVHEITIKVRSLIITRATKREGSFCNGENSNPPGHLHQKYEKNISSNLTANVKPISLMDLTICVLKL